MEKPATPLPCPFCGGEAWLHTPALPMVADCDDVLVSCSDCDASGPTLLFDQDIHDEADLPELEAEAIAAWNRRVPDPHLTAINAELVELLALAAGLIDDQLGGDFPELLQDIRTALARAKENSRGTD